MEMPYFDKDIVDFAAAIPPHEHVGLKSQKRVLRAALLEALPSEIANRPKAIQRIHHDAELSEILDEMSDELLRPESIQRRDLIETDYVSALRTRKSGSAYTDIQLYRLWTLLNVEIWHRLFVDERGKPATVGPGDFLPAG